MQPLPAVRVVLLDADNREIATQIYAPSADSLPPGEIMPFAVAFAEAGRRASEISIRFARRGPP